MVEEFESMDEYSWTHHCCACCGSYCRGNQGGVDDVSLNSFGQDGFAVYCGESTLQAI